MKLIGNRLISWTFSNVGRERGVNERCRGKEDREHQAAAWWAVCLQPLWRSGYANSATLSFCFLKDDNWYGLTSCHLVSRVGDQVFGFIDKKIGDTHCVRPIGQVVEISRAAYSLIFKVKQARPHHATHPWHATHVPTLPPHPCAATRTVRTWNAPASSSLLRQGWARGP